MTPFEFVFFLYAILLSLALTHLVSGWATAVRYATAIRWSLPYVLWSVTALLVTTGNLAWFWLMRGAPDWNAGLVLSNFALALLNYIWCVFITPEVARAHPLDLVAFYERERRRFLIPLVALEIFAIASTIGNAVFAGYANWFGDTVISLSLFVLTLAALIWRGERTQLAISVGMVGISIWYVFSASNIIGN